MTVRLNRSRGTGVFSVNFCATTNVIDNVGAVGQPLLIGII